MIKNLYLEENQWFWTYVDDEGSETQYRTNSYGEGMWEYVKTGTWMVQKKQHLWEWKQITGTCQFSLRGYSLSGARKKLKNAFSDD